MALAAIVATLCPVHNLMLLFVRSSVGITYKFQNTSYFRRQGSGPIFYHISLDCGDKGHKVGKSVCGTLRIGQQTLGAGGSRR